MKSFLVFLPARQFRKPEDGLNPPSTPVDLSSHKRLIKWRLSAKRTWTWALNSDQLSLWQSPWLRDGSWNTNKTCDLFICHVQRYFLKTHFLSLDFTNANIGNISFRFKTWSIFFLRTWLWCANIDIKGSVLLWGRRKRKSITEI